MGHHRKNNSKNSKETPNNNLNINDLSKMDLNSLINTLKDFDSNAIGNLLKQLNLPSNIDNKQIESLINSPDAAEKLSDMLSQINSSSPNSKGNMQNGINQDELRNILSKVNSPNVETNEVLESLKQFLPPDKCNILDRIIQMYKK